MKYTNYEIKTMINHVNKGLKYLKNMLHSHTFINKIILIKRFIIGVFIGIADTIKEINK